MRVQQSSFRVSIPAPSFPIWLKLRSRCCSPWHLSSTATNCCTPSPPIQFPLTSSHVSVSLARNPPAIVPIPSPLSWLEWRSKCDSFLKLLRAEDRWTAPEGPTPFADKSRRVRRVQCCNPSTRLSTPLSPTAFELKRNDIRPGQKWRRDPSCSAFCVEIPFQDRLSSTNPKQAGSAVQYPADLIAFATPSNSASEFPPFQLRLSLHFLRWDASLSTSSLVVSHVALSLPLPLATKDTSSR
mmetsp:Transcript_15236/g.31411  ORF Transcript_15236/g.31411 Transcript_15236/m.31411 type:complete len:241 (+) Transcript_15236:585-1307(+)